MCFEMKDSPVPVDLRLYSWGYGRQIFKLLQLKAFVNVINMIALILSR